jgi:serine protease Do
VIKFKIAKGLPAFVAAAMILSIPAPIHGQATQITDVFNSSIRLLLHSKSQSYLGVDVGDIDAGKVQTLKLKDTHGAEITVLDHDAPAGKAGLKLHDVVLQMNGLNIDTAEHFKKMLHEMNVGQKIQLVFTRDGVQQTINTQMCDRRKMQQETWEQLGNSGGVSTPAKSFLATGNEAQPTGDSGFHLFTGNSLKIGMMVEPLTSQTADLLGVLNGIIVKSVYHKSAADYAGFHVNDVILQVGSDPVATQADWERLLRSSEGKPVQIIVLRNQGRQIIQLETDRKHRKG